jgi:hypothetical protein
MGRPIESLYTGFGHAVGAFGDLVPEELEEVVADAHERRATNYDHAALGDNGSMLFTPRRFARRTYQCGEQDPEIIGGMVRFAQGCGLQFLSEAHLEQHQAETDEATGRPICPGSVMCPHCDEIGRPRCMAETALPSHIQSAHPEEG